jgi:uncharacterized alkaline shock family protein YloU
MRYNVPPRVRNLTGLDVTEVNITVKDVFFPRPGAAGIRRTPTAPTVGVSS